MTDSDCFGVLVVGCGAIAGRYETPPLLNTHCGGINAVAGLKLVGCVDIDQTAARALAHKFETISYENLSTALKTSRPDVVVVASASDSHKEVTHEVLTAATTPRVVLIEKPVTTNLVDYEALLELASSVNVKCLVNLPRRYWRSSSHLREIIGRGDLGQPVNVFGTYYGGLWNNGVHLIDYLDLLFSSSLSNISVSGIVPSRIVGDPSVEFNATLTATGAGLDVKAIDESLFQAFELDIWFSEGRIQISDFGEAVNVRFVRSNEIGERVLSSEGPPVEKLGFGQTVPIYESIEDFLRGGKGFDSRLEITSHHDVVRLVSQIHEMSQNWRK